MCKSLFKGLFGGNAPPVDPGAQPIDQATDKTADAVVKNTDVVAATAGREGSGRVVLGAKKNRNGAVAGLTI